jgi:hypothetical protein
MGPDQRRFARADRERLVSIQRTLAEASRHIQRNQSYMHQFIWRMTPKRLPEDVRGLLASFLGVPEDALRHPRPLAPRSPPPAAAAHNRHAIPRLPPVCLFRCQCPIGPCGRCAGVWRMRRIRRRAPLSNGSVDHLIWRATVTRAELEATLAELYGRAGDVEMCDAAGIQHVADRIRELWESVASLAPNEWCLFWADEF